MKETVISIKDFSTIIGVSNHLIYKIIKDKDLCVIAQGNKKKLPPATVRNILESRGFSYFNNNSPYIINLFGMKGGVGKTSLSTAIAEGASRLGFKVLAVDLDMQANLTQSFNKKKHGQPVLRDALKNIVDINDVIINVHPYLDLVPSSLDNSELEHFLSTQTINIAGYFKDIFTKVSNKYDLIITDCPPSVNKLTACAICFSHLNLIPLNADMDSYDGVMMSVTEIKRLEATFKDFNLKLNYKIVFNKYDAREKLSLVVMSEIAKNHNLRDSVLPIVVRTDTSFKNTKAAGEYIFDTYKTAAKEDCYNLIAEVTELTHWINQKHSKKIGVCTDDSLPLL